MKRNAKGARVACDGCSEAVALTSLSWANGSVVAQVCGACAATLGAKLGAALAGLRIARIDRIVCEHAERHDTMRPS